MNRNWFPWSGSFHGGSERVPGSVPPRYLGPENFKRAYRHVVERVRRVGASNISWVFHVNNSTDPDQPWNHMAAYYPGSDYVDWLGMSAYGTQYPTENWITVEQAIVNYYNELAELDPVKPIIVAKWGVGEFPRLGDKGA
jgi:beta-mannanase